jgi:hypothetical protein
VATKSKNPKEKALKTTETKPKTKERNHQTKILKTQPKKRRKTALKISLNASGMGFFAFFPCSFLYLFSSPKPSFFYVLK